MSEHQDSEFVLESIPAPNNGEAFHSIAEKNMGFFTMSFTTTGEQGRDYYYPTCYFSHKRYSVRGVLEDIRERLVGMFPTSHLTAEGVNVVGELFRTYVFDPHIDPVSDFVKLDSPGLKQTVFTQLFVKQLSIYKPGKDYKLVRMNVWFSTELKKKGKFITPPGWAPSCKPHHVVAHGVALDEVVFEVRFPSKTFHSIATNIAARPNMRTLLHILSDLVLPESIGREIGSIATCRLPIDSNSIKLPPGPTKWKPLKCTDYIANFRISIVDEHGSLLAYKGGNFSIILRIRPKK